PRALVRGAAPRRPRGGARRGAVGGGGARIRHRARAVRDLDRPRRLAGAVRRARVASPGGRVAPAPAALARARVRPAPQRVRPAPDRARGRVRGGFGRSLAGDRGGIAVSERIDRGTLLRVGLRANLLQAAWNFERQQGLGWAFALEPALRRLY